MIDDVTVPPTFHRCYAGANAIHKVLLLPSAEVLLERLKHRGDIYDELFQQQAPMLHSMLVSLDKAGWTVLDTSDQDVEQTVSAVLASLPRGL